MTDMNEFKSKDEVQNFINGHKNFTFYVEQGVEIGKDDVVICEASTIDDIYKISSAERLTRKGGNLNMSFIIPKRTLPIDKLMDYYKNTINGNKKFYCTKSIV